MQIKYWSGKFDFTDTKVEKLYNRTFQMGGGGFDVSGTSGGEPHKCVITAASVSSVVSVCLSEKLNPQNKTIVLVQDDLDFR